MCGNFRLIVAFLGLRPNLYILLLRQVIDGEGGEGTTEDPKNRRVFFLHANEKGRDQTMGERFGGVLKYAEWIQRLALSQKVAHRAARIRMEL